MRRRMMTRVMRAKDEGTTVSIRITQVLYMPVIHFKQVSTLYQLTYMN